MLQKIAPTEITPLALIGGSSLEKEVEKFKTAQRRVILSTVGRLFNVLHHKEGGACFNGSKLKMLVIDEADRVLDSSHSGVQLSFISSKISKQRRTGLFSATLTAGIREVVKAGMRNPYFVNVPRVTEIEVRELTSAEIDKIDEATETHELPTLLSLHYMKLELQSYKLPFLLHFVRE